MFEGISIIAMLSFRVNLEKYSDLLRFSQMRPDEGPASWSVERWEAQNRVFIVFSFRGSSFYFLSIRGSFKLKRRSKLLMIDGE